MIVVEEGRIVAIGPAGRTPVPAGAQRVDVTGRWIVPGLVDAHVHFTSQSAIDRDLLPLYLGSGITTALVMEGSPALLALRDSIEAGQLVGPTLYLAGPAVRDSSLGRADGGRLVEAQRAAGYDFVKIYNQASREGVRGILLRARALGVPVVGHVSRAMGVEGTIGSGQRGIVHLEEYLYTYFGFRNSDTTRVSMEALDPDVIPYLAAITAQAGVWVTPTMVTFESILGQATNLDSMLVRPGVDRVPPALFDALWAPANNSYAAQFRHPQHHENMEVALAYQRRMVRAFHEAGVRLLAGTDAPVPAVVPGSSLHDELRHFHDAGLQPCEVLATATRNAAEYLGRSGEFGELVVGSRADLLLVGQNPLEDLGTLARPVGVMARGRWVDTDAVLAVLDSRAGRGGRPARD